jgi:hypothetical protein
VHTIFELVMMALSLFFVILLVFFFVLDAVLPSCGPNGKLDAGSIACTVSKP